MRNRPRSIFRSKMHRWIDSNLSDTKCSLVSTCSYSPHLLVRLCHYFITLHYVPNYLLCGPRDNDDAERLRVAQLSYIARTTSRPSLRVAFRRSKLFTLRERCPLPPAGRYCFTVSVKYYVTRTYHIDGEVSPLGSLPFSMSIIRATPVCSCGASHYPSKVISTRYRGITLNLLGEWVEDLTAFGCVEKNPGMDIDRLRTAILFANKFYQIWHCRGDTLMTISLFSELTITIAGEDIIFAAISYAHDRLKGIDHLSAVEFLAASTNFGLEVDPESPDHVLVGPPGERSKFSVDQFTSRVGNSAFAHVFGAVLSLFATWAITGNNSGFAEIFLRSLKTSVLTNPATVVHDTARFMSTIATFVQGIWSGDPFIPTGPVATLHRAACLLGAVDQGSAFVYNPDVHHARLATESSRVEEMIYLQGALRVASATPGPLMVSSGLLLRQVVAAEGKVKARLAAVQPRVVGSAVTIMGSARTGKSTLCAEFARLIVLAMPQPAGVATFDCEANFQSSINSDTRVLLCNDVNPYSPASAGWASAEKQGSVLWGFLAGDTTYVTKPDLAEKGAVRNNILLYLLTDNDPSRAICEYKDALAYMRRWGDVYKLVPINGPMVWSCRESELLGIESEGYLPQDALLEWWDRYAVLEPVTYKISKSNKLESVERGGAISPSTLFSRMLSGVVSSLKPPRPLVLPTMCPCGCMSVLRCSRGDWKVVDDSDGKSESSGGTRDDLGPSGWKHTGPKSYFVDILHFDHPRVTIVFDMSLSEIFEYYHDNPDVQNFLMYGVHPYSWSASLILFLMHVLCGVCFFLIIYPCILVIDFWFRRSCSNWGLCGPPAEELVTEQVDDVVRSLYIASARWFTDIRRVGLSDVTRTIAASLSGPVLPCVVGIVVGSSGLVLGFFAAVAGLILTNSSTAAEQRASSRLVSIKVASLLSRVMPSTVRLRVMAYLIKCDSPSFIVVGSIASFLAAVSLLVAGIRCMYPGKKKVDSIPMELMSMSGPVFSRPDQSVHMSYGKPAPTQTIDYLTAFPKPDAGPSVAQAQYIFDRTLVRLRRRDGETFTALNLGTRLVLNAHTVKKMIGTSDYVVLSPKVGKGMVAQLTLSSSDFVVNENFDYAIASLSMGPVSPALAKFFVSFDYTRLFRVVLRVKIYTPDAVSGSISIRESNAQIVSGPPVYSSVLGYAGSVPYHVVIAGVTSSGDCLSFVVLADLPVCIGLIHGTCTDQPFSVAIPGDFLRGLIPVVGGTPPFELTGPPSGYGLDGQESDSVWKLGNTSVPIPRERTSFQRVPEASACEALLRDECVHPKYPVDPSHHVDFSGIWMTPHLRFLRKSMRGSVRSFSRLYAQASAYRRAEYRAVLTYDPVRVRDVQVVGSSLPFTTCFDSFPGIPSPDLSTSGGPGYPGCKRDYCVMDDGVFRPGKQLLDDMFAVSSLLAVSPVYFYGRRFMKDENKQAKPVDGSPGDYYFPEPRTVVSTSLLQYGLERAYLSPGLLALRLLNSCICANFNPFIDFDYLTSVFHDQNVYEMDAVASDATFDSSVVEHLVGDMVFALEYFGISVSRVQVNIMLNLVYSIFQRFELWGNIVVGFASTLPSGSLITFVVNSYRAQAALLLAKYGWDDHVPLPRLSYVVGGDDMNFSDVSGSLDSVTSAFSALGGRLEAMHTDASGNPTSVRASSMWFLGRTSGLYRGRFVGVLNLASMLAPLMYSSDASSAPVLIRMQSTLENVWIESHFLPPTVRSRVRSIVLLAWSRYGFDKFVDLPSDDGVDSIALPVSSGPCWSWR